MFIHLSKIAPRFFADPLEVMEDATICNAGVFRDFECLHVKLRLNKPIKR